MTATLADIRKAARGDMYTAVDDTTPAGHFLAVAKIVGIVTTYLLVGDEPSDDGQIIGRVESYGAGRALGVYVGGGLKGGTHRTAPDKVAAFRLMVEPNET